MKRYLKHALILLAALISFEAIISARVYLSNAHLVRTMELVSGQGYLAVPNAHIFRWVSSNGTALCGGLFFTLSLGALIGLVSLAAAAFYPKLPWPESVRRIVYIGALSGLLAWINSRGFLALESLALIGVPVQVFVMYRLTIAPRRRLPSVKKAGIHIIAPLVLAGILTVFAKGADSRLFSDFRDAFLMSNPVGMAVNDFYYTYTLAPAEVFKPLNKKLIKTARMETSTLSPREVRRLGYVLRSADYLITEPEGNPDLRVSESDAILRFYHGKTLVHQGPTPDFFKSPYEILLEISQKADRYEPYRTITGLALYTGLPLLMYLLFHGLIFCGFALVFTPEKAAKTATILCFVLGLAGFGLLSRFSPSPLDTQAIGGALASENSATRLSALHLIYDKELDIRNYPVTEKTASSPHVAERYWYARASSFSRHTETIDRMVRMLDDPHPNVRCQAMFALGNIRNRRAVPEIIRRIRTSDHWYVQWYGYKALKRLGWIQNPSVP